MTHTKAEGVRVRIGDRDITILDARAAADAVLTARAQDRGECGKVVRDVIEHRLRAERDRLAAENAKLRELVRLYVDPMNVRPDDQAAVDAALAAREQAAASAYANALDVPAALAQAKREGMEEAARIAEAEAQTLDDDGKWAEGFSDGCVSCAVAIRAKARENAP
jgi:hypothetical protein